MDSAEIAQTLESCAALLDLAGTNGLGTRPLPEVLVPRNPGIR